MAKQIGYFTTPEGKKCGIVEGKDGGVYVLCDNKIYNTFRMFFIDGYAYSIRNNKNPLNDNDLVRVKLMKVRLLNRKLIKNKSKFNYSNINRGYYINKYTPSTGNPSNSKYVKK